MSVSRSQSCSCKEGSDNALGLSLFAEDNLGSAVSDEFRGGIGTFCSVLSQTNSVK
ncbi:hypothetical protein D3C76_544590 [compost metagenome]